MAHFPRLHTQLRHMQGVKTTKNKGSFGLFHLCYRTHTKITKQTFYATVPTQKSQNKNSMLPYPHKNHKTTMQSFKEKQDHFHAKE